MKKQYVYTEKEYLMVLHGVESALEILKPQIESGNFDEGWVNRFNAVDGLQYAKCVLKGDINLEDDI